MQALAILIIAFLIWPPIALWRGYVVTVLWGWFVQPATNISAPSIYLVVGMLLLWALITTRKEPKEEGDALTNYLANVFAYGLLLPACFLGSGWIWKWLQWGVA